MFLDHQLKFSEDQAVAGTNATILSTNSIDLWQGRTALQTDAEGRAAVADAGHGQAPNLNVQVTADVVGGTSLQAQLVVGTGVDANGQISAGLEVIAETAAVPVAQLKAGYKFRLALPHGLTKRYLAVRYVGVGTITAGKVWAGLVGDRDFNYANY